jgi:hypothetical protein
MRVCVCVCAPPSPRTPRRFRPSTCRRCKRVAFHSRHRQGSRHLVEVPVRLILVARRPPQSGEQLGHLGEYVWSFILKGGPRLDRREPICTNITSNTRAFLEDRSPRHREAFCAHSALAPLAAQHTAATHHYQPSPPTKSSVASSSLSSLISLVAPAVVVVVQIVLALRSRTAVVVVGVLDRQPVMNWRIRRGSGTGGVSGGRRW